LGIEKMSTRIYGARNKFYLTLLDQLPDYTAIESYEPELASSSPAFWIASDILYQDNN